MKTSKLYFSIHATINKQKRGISANAIDCILQYGDCYYVGSGRTSRLITGKTLKQFPQKASDLQRYRNIAIICGQDGDVITVEHLYRRQKHWMPARAGGSR
jgi:hypothetical protein